MLIRYERSKIQTSTQDDGGDMKIVTPKSQAQIEPQPKTAGPGLKKLTTLIATTGLLTVGTGVAQANDLFNSFLDDISISSQSLNTPTGWTVDAFHTLSGP